MQYLFALNNIRLPFAHLLNKYTTVRAILDPDLSSSIILSQLSTIITIMYVCAFPFLLYIGYIFGPYVRLLEIYFEPRTLSYYDPCFFEPCNQSVSSSYTIVS